MQFCGRKLKAASLIEVIVSSIIFMIVFLFALSYLTKIYQLQEISNRAMEIENNINSYYQNSLLKGLKEGEHIYPFSWGQIKIEVESSNYNGLSEATIFVFKKENNRNEMYYKFLLPTQSDD